MTFEEFCINEDIQDIVSFNIFQIGELVKKLPDSFIMEHPYKEWKQIKGMRDRIAHGYDSVDLEIIYLTAKKDIDPLIDFCLDLI